MLAVVPVGAVDIKISGMATGYDAYRILDLSQGVKPGHAETGECPVEGCDKDADPEGHWNYAYSVNDKYRSAIMAGLVAVDVEGELDDRGVISEIEKLDNELTRMFADAVYGTVKSLEAEYGVDGSELAGVEPGYYLIAEKADAAAGDSVSLVMLDTAGLEEVKVTTKEDVPTLTKKIGYVGWNDSDVADSKIVAAGDEVWYTLVADLPSFDVLAGYDSYRLVFHDDVSSGLRIVPDSIECYSMIATSEYEPDVMGGFIADFRAFIRSEGDSMSDDSCDLELVIDDVKSIPDVMLVLSGVSTFASKPGIYWGPNRIVVGYMCEVLETAKVGPDGNPNTAKLEFSNNPYVEGPTTETPEDKCTVFTFGLHVNKTDGNNPLAGAAFSLYQYGYMPYHYDDNGDWVGGHGWWEHAVNPVDGSDGTQFEVNGLGAGKCRLVETKVPDGYQKCDDIEFEIIVESEEESDDPKLTKFDVVDMDGNSLLNGDEPMFMIDADMGMITTTVANYSGMKLPSTGGSGVYWIYGIGAAMVAAACVGLWRKRSKGTL